MITFDIRRLCYRLDRAWWEIGNPRDHYERFKNSPRAVGDGGIPQATLFGDCEFCFPVKTSEAGRSDRRTATLRAHYDPKSARSTRRLDQQRKDVLRIGLYCALPLLLLNAPTQAQGTGTTPPAPNSVSGNNGKSLSSKLSKSGGVIKPKENIDPGIAAPAPVPHPNSTPVIPPSATGGNTAK